MEAFDQVEWCRVLTFFPATVWRRGTLHFARQVQMVWLARAGMRKEARKYFPRAGTHEKRLAPSESIAADAQKQSRIRCRVFQTLLGH
jgi:hypothetical protein